MKKLLANRWKTPDGTILHSKYKHDFVGHLDKVNEEWYFIDGGNDYIRSSINHLPLVNLCVYSDGTFETDRQWMLWGKSFDKNMNPLPKTEYIPIKDLDTSHIYKILELSYLNTEYKKVMMEELVHRENLILNEN